jgi:hypothetical protein
MKDDQTMTTRMFLIAGLLAAVVFTGAAGGQDKKDLPDVQQKVPPIDAKALEDATAAKAAADLLEAAYEGKTPPEAVRELIAILRGSGTGGGDGWFGPAETRYTWQWLAKLHDIDPEKGVITPQTFRGSEALFARLDRDKDGQITAQDLDWSRTNKSTKPKGNQAKAVDPQKADARRAMLLRSLFAQEVGSMNEGPHVGQPAPNFKLRTLDGKETVELAKVIGKKPLVLVFGNYTCGPFCNAYPSVEPIYERFKADANFLMVYVRETHPTDGWNLGVDVKQPTTYAERISVAELFYKKVAPTIPVLVDEMNDPAGHAYSGMPSRLYVIDTQGIVAFKNGRGPFGFKTGEMEQALVMMLLDQTLQQQQLDPKRD